mmetsp:Transcript_66832/g.169502  ORF Transcript_66832/g.169502 Transcript_66832/m.169502 type:complete len:269 (+) Transcript_66832:334-1140(+)
MASFDERKARDAYRSTHLSCPTAATTTSVSLSIGSTAHLNAGPCWDTAANTTSLFERNVYAAICRARPSCAHAANTTAWSARRCSEAYCRAAPSCLTAAKTTCGSAFKFLDTNCNARPCCATTAVMSLLSPRSMSFNTCALPCTAAPMTRMSDFSGSATWRMARWSAETARMAKSLSARNSFEANCRASPLWATATRTTSGFARNSSATKLSAKGSQATAASTASCSRLRSGRSFRVSLPCRKLSISRAQTGSRRSKSSTREPGELAG